MSISTPNSRRRAAGERRSESGFTMVEMVIALLILFVGLMATASAISYALMASNRGRSVTNSKLLVISVLEQMETLRNTKQLVFKQIANTGSVDNIGMTYQFAGFPSTAQPVSKDPGPDGIFGTADDLTAPGVDQIYGTVDDVPNDQSRARAGYTRTITITTLSPNIKKITVALTYPGAAGEVQTLRASSYLNNDAQANFLN